MDINLVSLLPPSASKSPIRTRLLSSTHWGPGYGAVYCEHKMIFYGLVEHFAVHLSLGLSSYSDKSNAQIV